MASERLTYGVILRLQISEDYARIRLASNSHKRLVMLCTTANLPVCHQVAHSFAAVGRRFNHRRLRFQISRRSNVCCSRLTRTTKISKYVCFSRSSKSLLIRLIALENRFRIECAKASRAGALGAASYSAHQSSMHSNKKNQNRRWCGAFSLVMFDAIDRHA